MIITYKPRIEKNISAKYVDQKTNDIDFEIYERYYD
jgi:hypothetical protein